MYESRHASSAVHAGAGLPAVPDRLPVPMQVSVKVTADMDLADHVLSFLNVALSSPEAQHALALRKAFVLTLLDLGQTLPLKLLPA